MPRQWHTGDFPIKNDYYYIVSFGNFLRLTLYPVFFVNKASAQRAINLHIPKGKQHKYEILHSRKLKDFKFTYTIRLGVLSKFTKYEYGDKVTRQDRKSYRTLMRRRLRRMGMLTLIKPKLDVRKPVPQTRLIHNRQEVANNPGTSAKAFKLDRHNKKYMYIILDKKVSPAKRILFELKVIRINLKIGKCKKMSMRIYNKDVIRPYLLKEVGDAINKKSTEIYDKCRKYCLKRGINIY